ncbi:MAG: hypothetical protein RIR11_2094 [Bacteroidota bacterium]
MKKLLTFFAFLCLLSNLSAQIAPNSIAPNFNATDINGNTVNLYEIIESGKPVIMDVSATWCGPCWNYHIGGALETLYEEYGPNGTNELMVIFVEGDPNTGMECLMGNTAACPNTRGNWILDTPYPIIDDASIADAYEIAYFPTVYLICSNHLVSEVGALSKSALKAKADACPEPKPGVDFTALAFDSDYTFGRICGTQTITPNMLMLNSGTDTIKSVVIELRVNGQLVQTLDYTTPVPSFLPKVIEFAPVNVTGATIIKSTVKSLNGTALATPIVKQKSYQKAKATATKELTLELKTDGFGQETYWELIDEQGEVYAFGGNELVGPNGANTGEATPGPGAYANNQTFIETMEVPANGCYFLHMVDAYGDGMCDQNTTGSYKLFETATPTNVLAEGGCNFADARNIFGADGIVGTNNLVEEGSMRVFPNPAKDMIRVDFSMKNAADVQITVTNALGQIVRDMGAVAFNAGSNNKTIDVANLAAGIYVINLRTAEGSVARTFSVKQ